VDQSIAEQDIILCLEKFKSVLKLSIDSMLSKCHTVVMESPGIPDDPLSRFSLSIFRLNGLLIWNGDRITGSIGQSSARWQVLGRVGYQPQTVAQMARDMGHARQSVQRLADVLAKEGLVVYKDNPADQRTRLLELTPPGAEILAEIYAQSEEWSRQMMTKLDAMQLAEVSDALDKIAHILETDEKQDSPTRSKEKKESTHGTDNPYQ
jgi:DNA-binding MarR family transcriptional regulator